jgi:hypothetical protein
MRNSGNKFCHAQAVSVYCPVDMPGPLLKQEIKDHECIRQQAILVYNEQLSYRRSYCC